MVGLALLHHFVDGARDSGEAAAQIESAASADDESLESGGAVVAIEGCIFASDLEAVSGPLNRLGAPAHPRRLPEAT